MNKVFIPISIVVSGLIIAGAIYLTTKQQAAVNNPPADQNIELAIKPVDSKDHIRGNPDAEIIIVEYSDFECPYCKGFHGTMARIMEEYGTTGKVAWVYRHFPLVQIHKNAQPAAEATECVAKVGGNDKFWEYSDNITAGSPESLSKENLLAEAVKIGINEAEFKACLASDYPKKEVAEDAADGNAIAKVDREFGTPYNILISKSGAQTPIRGNQPYATVKGIIDTILAGEGSN
jgi:protein-disulfide isomerase